MTVGLRKRHTLLLQPTVTHLITATHPRCSAITKTKKTNMAVARCSAFFRFALLGGFCALTSTASSLRVQGQAEAAVEQVDMAARTLGELTETGQQLVKPVFLEIDEVAVPEEESGGGGGNLFRMLQEDSPVPSTAPTGAPTMSPVDDEDADDGGASADDAGNGSARGYAPPVGLATIAAVAAALAMA